MYHSFLHFAAALIIACTDGKVRCQNFDCYLVADIIFAVLFRTVRELKAGCLPFKPLLKPQSIPGFAGWVPRL